MTKRKIIQLSEDEKARTTEMYRAGMEMEDIAADLCVSLPLLSRYIHDTGLGHERYGDIGIHNTGSATPI